jgi:hypothetical protein
VSRFDDKLIRVEPPGPWPDPPAAEKLQTIALANVQPLPSLGGATRWLVSFALDNGVRIEAFLCAANSMEAEIQARRTIRERWQQWKGMV